jgi:hypothetical protein
VHQTSDTWPCLHIIPVVHLTPAKLVMANPGNVLNLVNPCQFDKNEWIGNGRTYPTNQKKAQPLDEEEELED